MGRHGTPVWRIEMAVALVAWQQAGGAAQAKCREPNCRKTHQRYAAGQRRSGIMANRPSKDDIPPRAAMHPSRQEIPMSPETTAKPTRERRRHDRLTLFHHYGQQETIPSPPVRHASLCRCDAICA
jgi:hypothetical protein